MIDRGQLTQLYTWIAEHSRPSSFCPFGQLSVSSLQRCESAFRTAAPWEADQDQLISGGPWTRVRWPIILDGRYQEETNTAVLNLSWRMIWTQSQRCLPNDATIEFMLRRAHSTMSCMTVAHSLQRTRADLIYKWRCSQVTYTIDLHWYRSASLQVYVTLWDSFNSSELQICYSRCLSRSWELRRMVIKFQSECRYGMLSKEFQFPNQRLTR